MTLENLLLDFKFQLDMQNTWPLVSAISKAMVQIYYFDYYFKPNMLFFTLPMLQT